MDQAAYSTAVFYITGLDRRHKINRNVGWIYAARNSQMGPGIIKIGMSARPPDRRAVELMRSTGYPGRFELIYFIHVSDRYQAEKWVHRSLDEYRVRSWEEFFDLPLSVALGKMDEAALHFPLMTGRPGRLMNRGRPQHLPQPFRKATVRCGSCDRHHEIRELAIRVRVTCSDCGCVLVMDPS